MKADNLFSFLGGALIGAAAAILFAPESGEETRKKIKESIDKEYNELKLKNPLTKSTMNSKKK